MPIPHTPGTLGLHVDSGGHVWWADNAETPRNSHLTVEQFFDRHGQRLAEAPQIRLLGVAENHWLLSRLYAMEVLSGAREIAPRIRLTGPNFLRAPVYRYNPYAVVYSLNDPDLLGASRANWYPLTLDVYIAANFDLQAQSPEADAEKVMSWLRAHPAWPALQFVQPIDVPASAALLGAIGDPRWYRHPDRPGRLGRLYSFLGLTPRAMRGYLSGDPEELDRHFLAVAAVRAWHVFPRGEGFRAGNFLFDETRKEGASDELRLLTTTRRFVAFVHRVWLTLLTHNHPEAGFDVSRFFGDPLTAGTFAEFFPAALIERQKAWAELLEKYAN